jgi:hypothetical protein
MKAHNFLLTTVLLAACAKDEDRSDSGDVTTDSGDTTTDTGIAPELSTFYMDEDGDGYGTEESTEATEAPEGYAAEGGDCNDTDAMIHPGMTEACDGIDNDCDGTPDQDIDPNWPNTPDLWETIDYPFSDFPFTEVVMLEYSRAHDSLWAVLAERDDVDFQYALYEYKDGTWSFDQILIYGPNPTGPYKPTEFHIDPNGQMYLLGANRNEDGTRTLFFRMRDFNEDFWTEFEMEYLGTEERSAEATRLVSRLNESGEHQILITGRTVSVETGIQSTGVWELDSTGLTQTDDHVITDAADRDHYDGGLAVGPDGLATYVASYEDVDDLYVAYVRQEQNDGSYTTLSEVHLTGEVETYEHFSGLTIDSNGRFFTNYSRWNLDRTKPAVFGIYTGLGTDSSTYALIDILDSSESDDNVYIRPTITAHPRGTIFSEAYTRTPDDGSWDTDPSRTRHLFAGDENGFEQIAEDTTYKFGAEAMLIDSAGKLWRASTTGLHVLSCWAGQ